MTEGALQGGVTREEPRRYQNYVVVGIFVMLVPLTMALMQYKTPTILMPLMELFGMDAVEGAWLMSIFLLMGAIMSIPVSLLCQKIGPFKVTLCATVCAVLGSILGAFTTSYPLLLISRGMEGIGECACAVIGPVIIESCVNPQRVGTAMGIWAVWGSLGATIAALYVPTVFDTMGPSFLWLLDAAFAVLATVLMFIMVKDPTHYNRGQGSKRSRAVAHARSGAGKGGAEADVQGAGVGAPVRYSTNDGYKPRYRDLLHRDCLLCFLGFAMFNVSLLAVLGYVPTLLQLNGADVTVSGFASTLPVMLSIISSPLFGVLSDRTGRTRLLLVIALACAGPCVVLMYTHTDAALWVAATVMGLTTLGCSGLGVVALMRALPYPSLKTKAMGVMITLQNLGSFTGSFLVQALLGPDFANVGLAAGVVFGLCMAGAVCYASCKSINGMPQR